MATLVVVRRGASETFHHLQGAWAPKLGGDLTVMWDRRTNDRRGSCAPLGVERRVGVRREVEVEWPDSLNDVRCQEPELRPERRHTQRRRRPPDVWRTLGFLVVRGEEGPG